MDPFNNLLAKSTTLYLRLLTRETKPIEKMLFIDEHH